MDDKVEKKMVSIELPELYVRNIAKFAERTWKEDYAGMALPKIFISKCCEWSAANPEPKKTRPMTIKEKLEWAYENKDMKVRLFFQEGKGDYRIDYIDGTFGNFCLNDIITAKNYLLPGEYLREFEVEVTE